MEQNNRAVTRHQQPTNQRSLSNQLPKDSKNRLNKRKSNANETGQSSKLPKRSRQNVSYFQSDHFDIPRSARSLTNQKISRILVYERGDFLAVRNEEGEYFLCQCTHNVYQTTREEDQSKPFKIRWLESVNDEKKAENRRYKLAYYDSVYLSTVISQCNLTRQKDGLYSLTEKEDTRLLNLLNAAIEGKSLSEVIKDFSPISKPTITRRRKRDSDDEYFDDESDDETYDPRSSPRKQRRPVLSKQETLKIVVEPEPVASTSKDNKTDVKRRASSRLSGRLTIAKVPDNNLPKKRKRVKKKISFTNQIEKKKPTKTKKVKVSKLKKSSTSVIQRQSSYAGLKRYATKIRDAIHLRKQDPNKKLIPNNNVELLEKDPLFYSRIEVPSISPSVDSKLLYRAALLGDCKLLKSYLEDKNHILLKVRRSLHQEQNYRDYAIVAEKEEMIQLLCDYPSNNYRNVVKENVRLLTESTGTYNPRTLGLAKVRKVQLSRGGREGNNALTKRCSNPSDYNLLYYLEENVSLSALLFLAVKGIITENELFSSIKHVIRLGNRKLAGELMREANKKCHAGFNDYHIESCLINDDSEWKIKDFRENSVKKTPTDNDRITPIHCAAINPNVNFLKLLLEKTMISYDIEDDSGWRPIHYAAACEGPEPLKYLIEKGASIDQTTKSNLSPLVIACKTGRSKNIEVLLKVVSDKQAADISDPKLILKMVRKFGAGNINKGMKSSWAPIHIAIINDRLDTIKVLVTHGADINKVLNANYDRMTPLMLAARNGNLEICKYLIANKAQVQKTDKLGRTALIHAILDGHSHVTSYLLRLGSDPNQIDSSGNSCVHYAAAYGWYFCLKALISAGAEIDKPNSWKLTPLAASFFKGHEGITDYLLNNGKVDVNFTDADDKTLLIHVIIYACPVNESTYEMVLKLLSHKADPTKKDSAGNNALHYLLESNLPTLPSHTRSQLHQVKQGLNTLDELSRKKLLETEAEFYKSLESCENVLIKIADLLLENGVNLLEDNSSGNNFIFITLDKNKDFSKKLFNHLLSKIMFMEEKVNSSNENILHLLAKKCNRKIVFDVYKKLLDTKWNNNQSSIDVFKRMALQKDKNHLTPLFVALNTYQNLSCYYGYLIDNEMEKEHWMQFQNVLDFIELLCKDLQPEIQYSYEIEIGGKMEKYHKSIVWCCLDKSFLTNENNWKEKCKNSEYRRYQCFELLEKYGKYDIDLPQNHVSYFVKLIGDNRSDDFTLDLLTYLLKKGANINLPDYGGSTPLLIASLNGNKTLIKYLLKNGANINDRCPESKKTVLHRVINSSLTKPDKMLVIQWLLNKGSDINAVDFLQSNILHETAQFSSSASDDCKDLEQMLIRKGANLFAKDCFNRMPIHYLFVSHNWVTTCSDPVESYTIFSSAMSGQQLDSVDGYGQNLLHMAALRDATVCCMLLLKKGLNINSKDMLGNSPLGLAVAVKAQSTALMLMQNNADINMGVNENFSRYKCYYDLCMEKKRNSPSEVVGDRVESIKEHSWRLLPNDYSKKNTGDDKPRVEEDVVLPIFQGIVRNGWTGLTFIAIDTLEPFGMRYASAVEIAIKLKKFSFAMKLIEKQMQDEKLLTVNEKKENLLHILAYSVYSSGNEYNNFEALLSKNDCQDDELRDDTDPRKKLSLELQIAVELVEKRKVCVNDKDCNGMTALNLCFIHNNLDLVNYLLSREEIDVNLSDNKQRTALYALIAENHPRDTIKKYVKLMSERNMKTINDLYSLETEHHFSNFLRKNTYYNDSTTTIRNTPLIFATANQDYSLMKFFIEYGADLRQKNSQGQTALMIAVQRNDEMAVRILFCAENRSVVGVLIPSDPYYKRPIQPEIVLDNEEASYEELKMKSDLNVNAQDIDGRTALHYFVTSLPFGIYENGQIVHWLLENGADVNIKDKNNRTAFDYANENKCSRIARLLAKKAKRILSKSDNTDILNWIDDKISYIDMDTVETDARLMIEKIESDYLESIKNEPKSLPDSRSRIKNGRVLIDNTMDKAYDILMTKVDVKVGEDGLYNFYKMQIIEDDKGVIVLFTCWGRIGDVGQFQKTPYGNEDEAVEEFKKIFKAKSGNNWEDINEFKNLSKKYRLISEDKRKEHKKPNVEFHFDKSIVKCTLPPCVENMIVEWSNIQMLGNHLSSSGIKMAFGYLTKEMINDALVVLEKLKASIIQLMEFDRITLENMEEYKIIMDEISDLSSEYYYIVPVNGMELEKLPPIDNLSKVEKLIQVLYDMYDVALAIKFLLAAKYRMDEINPYDYIYRAMGTKIKELKEESDESQLILKYIRATSDNKVKRIYRLDRFGEVERFNKCGIKNDKLLWHGTRTSNMMGILKKGLLIAPAEAPVTGYMFGKGIYTADCFEKSRGYCYGHTSKRYMLLCQVALGREMSLDERRFTDGPIMDKEFNSVRANGRTIADRRFDAVNVYGMKIALGKSTFNTDAIVSKSNSNTDEEVNCKKLSRSLTYNEFIVYDERQACMRYLIEFVV